MSDTHQTANSNSNPQSDVGTYDIINQTGKNSESAISQTSLQQETTLTGNTQHNLSANSKIISF